MTAADWIGLAGLGLPLAGAMFAGVSKLTRMAVALETLAGSMARLSERVAANEAKIAVLEQSYRQRAHRPPWL